MMLFSGIKTQLEQHRNRLYRLAYAWCGDRMLADDLVQDTLSKAIKNKDQLREMAKLEQWLFRILHNCWMGYLRRNRPETDLDSILLIDEFSPESCASKLQVIESVRNAVARLPVGQRQVITLVDLEELKYSDVAEILDIPMGTVMSRLSRARISLKEALLHLKDETPIEKPRLLRRVK